MQHYITNGKTKIKLKFFIIIVFAIISSPKILPQNKFDTNYKKVLNELLNLQVDSSKAGSIEDYTLTRDAGTYFFESGIIYPCKPIAGRVRAAVFVGKGTFSYTPPNKIEKDQLFRFYEKKNLKSNIEYVFMLFADSTFEQLKEHFSYDNLNNYDKADEVIKETIRFISEKDKDYFDTYLMKEILEDMRNDFFFSVT